MNTGRLALIALLVAVVCGLVVGGVFAFVTHPALGTAYTIAITLVVVNVIVRWVRFLRPDQMMVHLILGGVHYRTTVTSSYVEQQSYLEWKERVDSEDDQHGRPRRSDIVKVGLLGNVALVFWPFERGVIWPTSALDLPIHVDDVFTKEDKGASVNERAHRTQLRFKITVTMRFSPYVTPALQALSLVDKPINDFSQLCTIEDNSGHKYPDTPLLVKEMLPIAQPSFLEGVRKSAAGFTWLGRRDILDRRASMEREARKILCQHESALVHAGIFKRNTQMSFGPAVLSVDILFERPGFQPVAPDASELEKAVNRPTIALLDARAEADRRRGEGEGIQAKAAAANLDPSDVLNAQTLEKVQQVQLIGAGERLVRLVGNLVRRPQ